MLTTKTGEDADEAGVAAGEWVGAAETEVPPAAADAMAVVAAAGESLKGSLATAGRKLFLQFGHVQVRS